MEITEVISKKKWGLDKAHSEITFKIRHLMIANVSGKFKEFDASIYTTGDDFITSEIDFWLNPASVDTGDAKRDEHITGPDFFDVQNHKQITFIGNTYEKDKKDGFFHLYGALTIKGVTKQIKLLVEFGGVTKDPWGNEKAGFSISGAVSRKEWDLTWNAPLETGGLLVGDQVTISCELQLVKK